MSNISALPVELISNIASLLDLKDLRSLRQTCRVLERSTFTEFAVRGYSHRDAMLSSSSTGILIKFLSTSRQLASHVKTALISGATPNDPLSAWKVETTTATALVDLLSLMPSLESLKLIYLDSQRSQIARSFLNLDQSSHAGRLPSIQKLELRNSLLSSQEYIQLLSSFATNLTKLRIQHAYCKDGTWAPVLTYAQSLELETLNLAALMVPKYGPPLENEQRLVWKELLYLNADRTFSGRQTGSSEIYWTSAVSAGMVGAKAVQAGLSEIIEFLLKSE